MVDVSCPPAGAARTVRAAWSSLCEMIAAIAVGPQIGSTYRFHARGGDVGQMCLGTLIRVRWCPKRLVKSTTGAPLDKAALIGCGAC